MSDRKPYAYVVPDTSKIVRKGGEVDHITVEMGVANHPKKLSGAKVLGGIRRAFLKYVRTDHSDAGPRDIYLLTVHGSIHLCAAIENLIMHTVAGRDKERRETLEQIKAIQL